MPGKDKPEEKKEETRSLMISVTGNHTGEKARFQQNNKVCFVPFNKSVEVPLWVYQLYLDSHWNPDNNIPDTIKEDIQKDS